MPRLPNGKAAPKKKKPAPKRKPSIKGSEAIPGYKVPKKLLKNTKANRKAAGDASLSADQLFKKMKKKELKEYEANDKKRSTSAKKKPAPTPSQRSDWEAGLKVRDWAKGQKKPWE